MSVIRIVVLLVVAGAISLFIRDSMNKPRPRIRDLSPPTGRYTEYYEGNLAKSVDKN